MDVDVDVVPRREPAMEPFEVMTSESQERMLAIVTPADRDAVEEVCRRWEVRATVIGTVTDGGRLRILDADGAVLADVPAASLSDDAPLYDRPRSAPADLEARRRDDPGRALFSRRSLSRPERIGADVLALLADASWVVPPVRPPALPQHRGRSGRGRRGAAVWRHRACRRATGDWPSPPTPIPAGARSTPGRARP